ncbi:hypothetical protein [Bacillus gaemokensis]|uniref:hypothetical protein n=1 Tax=Bacillus gaemokensis TaxID=574375 RepID=UPI00068D65FD|nr:hypothetical protein [Bacillus gaemokensis]KYG31005.1 hypothetical protein AZF08_27465 [Bacillus gaemokensis]
MSLNQENYKPKFRLFSISPIPFIFPSKKERSFDVSSEKQRSSELKDLCFRHILEHRIQLVPPAKKGTTKVNKQLFATIEKVCSEVVVISGFIRKIITYTTVINGQEIPNQRIEDDIPFEYLIESTDIKENNQFTIIEKKILGELLSHETNFGKSDSFQNNEQILAFSLVEKDIIKISIGILPIF